MPSRRMPRPSVGRIVAVLVLILAVLTESKSINAMEVEKQCPPRCECNLTATPNILCSEDRFSLPGSIPLEARSLQCTNCHIARMHGKDFQNYTGLRALSLEGSSRPVFDEEALRFLRSVPELTLEGYELTPSDFLSLVGANRTLTVRISLVTPTSSSSPPTVASSTGSDRLSTSVITTKTADGPNATLGISDNRSVGGGDQSSTNTHHSATSEDKVSVQSSTSSPGSTIVPKIEGASSFPLFVMVTSFTVLVLLMAALIVYAVRACTPRNETRYLEHVYNPINPPNTIGSRLKESLKKMNSVLATEQA